MIRKFARVKWNLNVGETDEEDQVTGMVISDVDARDCVMVAADSDDNERAVLYLAVADLAEAP